MAESLIVATLGAQLSETFDGHRLHFAHCLSRAELRLSDQTMERIIEDAELTVPDILWP